jgi:hypothetical protein
MKQISYSDLTLREQEAELVAACIDHEDALLTAISILPVDDFRSQEASDLRQVFYVLAGWYSSGTYDPETNRDSLALYFDEIYIDGLWCPFGVVKRYVRGLAQNIAAVYREQDEVIGNIRRLVDSGLVRASDDLMDAVYLHIKDNVFKSRIARFAPAKTAAESLAPPDMEAILKRVHR